MSCIGIKWTQSVFNNFTAQYTWKHRNYTYNTLTALFFLMPGFRVLFPSVCRTFARYNQNQSYTIIKKITVKEYRVTTFAPPYISYNDTHCDVFDGSQFY